jgi:hypothetical protein
VELDAVTSSKVWWSPRRRWIWAAAGGITLCVVACAYRIQGSVRRQLPAYVRGRLEQALKRRVRMGGIALWPPGSFTIRDLEVLPAPGEAVSPLRARSARVEVSWWDLLLHRRLAVQSIHLNGPRVEMAVDLRPLPRGHPSVNERILTLASLGIGSIGVSDGRLDLVATLPDASRQTIRAGSISGELRVSPRRFWYAARAAGWSAGGISAASLRLRGEGDARATRVSDCEAACGPGQLRARGSYQEGGRRLDAEVAVRDFPLATAARRMGMPDGWKLAGRVSGTVTVAAAGGALQRVRGELEADAGELQAAGMPQEFQWSTASAAIDWRQDGVRLRRLRVNGDGIQLAADVSVDGSPADLLARGAYHARGSIRVVGRESVDRLARLLACRSPLGGGWTAHGASIDFDASGSAARINAARATGKFSIVGLSLKPEGADAAVQVRRLASDFSRDANGLRLRAWQAEADGANASGSLLIENETARDPARFEAAARVRIADASALRRLLPRAAMWRWLGGNSPGAGEFDFRASGPVRDIAAVHAEGRFSLRDALLSFPGPRTTPMPAAGAGILAVKRAVGRFVHDQHVLRLDDVVLATDDLEIRGMAALAGLDQADPLATINGDVCGTHWERLPGVAPRMSRRLRGGRYTARIAIATPLSRLAVAPVSGDFTLTGARLVWPEAVGDADRERAVQSLTARYVREGDTLRLSDVRLRADALTATGSAFVQSIHARDPVVNVEVRTEVDRWERLGGIPPALRRFVHGGRLTARLNMAGPMSALDTEPWSGDFRLEGGTLAWEGRGGRTETQPVQVMTGAFRTSRREAILSDLSLRAGGIQLAGEVSISPLAAEDPVVSVKARAAIEGWERLPGLPECLCRHLRGGRLLGSIVFGSPLSRLDSADLTGEFQLENARLTDDSTAAGPAVDRSIRRLSGRFACRSPGIELAGLSLAGDGLEASGSLRFASRVDPNAAIQADVRLIAEGWDRLPGFAGRNLAGLRGGRLGLSVRGQGRLAALGEGDWTGDLRLEDGELASASGLSAEAQEPLAIRLLRTGFAHREGRWALSGAQLETPICSVRGSGELLDVWEDDRLRAAGGDSDARSCVLEFSGSMTRGNAAAVLNRIAPLAAVRGGSMTATFRLAGPLDAPERMEISGSTQIREASYQPDGRGGSAPAPVALHRIDAEFHRVGRDILFPKVEAVLPLCRFAASGRVADIGVEGSRPTLDARVRIVSDPWQKMLGIESGWDGLVGGRLTLDTQLAGIWTGLAFREGTFLLENAGLRVPDSAETLPVRTLSGGFVCRDNGVDLLRMKLDSPIGSAEGRGELRGTGDQARHLFEARWQTDQPMALLRPFVALPGTIKGGRLSGTLTFRGGGRQPTGQLEGEFTLAKARYVPPATANGSAAHPIPITQLRGLFRCQGGRTSLQGMKLQSPKLSVDGSIDFLPDSDTDSGVLVHAQLELADVGSFLDYWPLLRGRVSGGSLRADLTFRGDVTEWSHTRGSGNIEAAGGHFLIPEADEPYQRASFSPLKAEVAWDGDGMQIRSLSLRGNKYNVNCAGAIRYAGRIDVAGKAWLTRAFGRSLMPTGVIRFVGHLLGIMPKEVDSSFRLAGSIDRPSLSMGITRTAAWRYARQRIDPAILRVATGRDPLWDLSAAGDRKRPTASAVDPKDDDD